MSDLAENLVEILGDHTAGDPMREDVIWTYLSGREIAEQLAAYGTPVSTKVVGELLGELGFSRRQAQKRRTMGRDPRRNEQFERIATLKWDHFASGDPVISMDTKKKELVGNFHRPGRGYTNGLVETFDHDFPSHAQGKVIPHGLYDLGRNVGHITLGLSHDTSEFACASFWTWWRDYARQVYGRAKRILLLCDCGGSNNARHHIFKEDLHRLAGRIGLPIRVAHYPPYCSKYNPIEHRLFPHVTRACQGVIFHTLDIVKRFIRRTKTQTGLRVTLNVLPQPYETQRKASDQFLQDYPILHDDYLPEWNYVAKPA
jgi:hypothetical protein